MRYVLATFIGTFAGFASPLLAQAPAIPAGPIRLIDAINLGRHQGVEAVVARLNVREANARTAQRRADLLPNIGGRASLTRQTLNLDEFGIPVATGVTDPFDIYDFQIHASQTLFDASVIAGCGQVGTPRLLPDWTPRRSVRSPARPRGWRISGSSAPTRPCGPGRPTAP